MAVGLLSSQTQCCYRQALKRISFSSIVTFCSFNIFYVVFVLFSVKCPLSVLQAITSCFSLHFMQCPKCFERIGVKGTFATDSRLWRLHLSLFSLQHIVKCHGSTLLPQFLGMYRVSVDNEETYLIVMRNMFSHRLVVHRKYDLKVHKNVSGLEQLTDRNLSVWHKLAIWLKDEATVVLILCVIVCLFLQGSLVDREASDKERVKEAHCLSFDFLMRPCPSWVSFPVGKRASNLQGHGFQEQHAESVCKWGAEGQVHGETQQRCGGRGAAVPQLHHTVAAPVKYYIFG